ncbi:MAG: FeoC-like transcriptional regulator [Chloroflexota bacterium]|nr:FeoC-like transcriptional regulator [Chloroflexota bacterium]
MSGVPERSQSESDTEERDAGLDMADLLELPPEQRQVVNWMMRKRQATLAEIAAYLGKDEEVTRALLAELVGKGFVRERGTEGDQSYRIRYAPKKNRKVPLDIWQALDLDGDEVDRK